jgi:uncharacterized protein involved in exopolysaccharide biosynthesis
MQPETKTLRDYLAVLRRRKTQFAAVAGTLFVIAWAVAWWLPAIYRSTATIMIEQQEIPQDLVGATISSFADQRIQVISQQAMSRASLMKIIEKYGLYGADKTGKATSGKVDRLRKNINLELVKVDVTDRSGNKTAATIAFTLSYDGETAELAQRVTNELADLFLSANIKERKEQAAETSTFFTAEADKLSQHISRTEAQLAAFKARNMGRLPEQVQLNLQQKDRVEGEIREVDRQTSALEERKFNLEAQLAQVKPTGPMVSASGERILDDTERLKLLQSKYAGLSGQYSSDHPDMIKLRHEIDALQKETGGTAELDEQAKQLARLRAELITARDRYSDDHPDVIRLKKAIAALEAAGSRPAAVARARDTRPDNPAFITLQSQIEATASELKSLRAKRAELKASILSIDLHLAQAPQVEREYLDLVRDHDNSLKRYEEIKGKQMQAQIAQQLERDSKAERFTLLDPPQLPEGPHSPNRLAIVFLGMLLSVGSGAAYAGVRESLDDSIHGRKALAALSKVPLLASIPYVEAERGEGQIRRLSKLGTASLPAVFAVAVALTQASSVEVDRPAPSSQQRGNAPAGSSSH